MHPISKTRILFFISFLLWISACRIPKQAAKPAALEIPSSFPNIKNNDSINIASVKWDDYFQDPYLVALIDTALRHNQELQIIQQEIEQVRNEIRIRKGEYLPFVSFAAGAGVDKKARYTNLGAMEANTEIAPEHEMPEPLTDLIVAAKASWEMDIWGKLHNAKRAAVAHYLATREGKNFMVTNLVAEIANSYYELLSLDRQLEIIKRNITIQQNAFEMVKLQKKAARLSELAVKRFEAQVLKTTSLQYHIRQKITETENKINFLLGRYAQPVARNAHLFEAPVEINMHMGNPNQLLEHRADVRKAIQEIAAAQLDVKVAKAQFYPSLGLSAAIGLQGFNFKYFIKSPESILYSLAADMVAPLVNRNAIKANYKNANARQIQALYHYDQILLNAYMEVFNQIAQVNNLDKSFTIQEKQVAALSASVDIAGDLFKAARANYVEVLLTQREMLEAKFELVETKMKQYQAKVNIYRALGGGWQ